MSIESTPADRRLDVREVDGEPFGDIAAALEDLTDDESFLLINSFEPEPLYDVLEARGFTYQATNPEPNVWHVEIEHA
jgi:uncharacterized protein (DUF2249 family)